MKLQLSTMFLKPEITLYWVDLAHIFEQKFKTDKFKLKTNLRFFVDYSSIYYIIQLIKNNSFRVRYGIANRKHCY